MMKAKRYIKIEEAAELTTLEEGSKHSSHPQFKDRCHCIVLSIKGYDMEKLSEIFNVSRPTITNWYNSWEKHGIMGLYNSLGQGRKPILQDCDKELVKAKVKANPQELKKARDAIKEELSKDFSEKTLKRFLKSLVRHPGDGGVKA